MLNCRKITELCSEEMERPLGLGERLSLRVHFMMCSGCSNFRGQMRELREVMRAYAQGRAADAEEPLPAPDALR